MPWSANEQAAELARWRSRLPESSAPADSKESPVRVSSEPGALARVVHRLRPNVEPMTQPLSPVTLEGLAGDTARRRLAEVGPNALQSERRGGWWRTLLEVV